MAIAQNTEPKSLKSILEDILEKYMQKRGGIAIVEPGFFDSATMAAHTDGKLPEKVASSLINFTEAATNFDKKLPAGYNIEFEPYFHYQPGRMRGSSAIFYGSTLVLRNQEKKQF